MILPKHYNPQTSEPELQGAWQEAGIYSYNRDDGRPVYSIDTPPPTVSGNLHLGHVFSYSHADFIARFWRMNGYRVFYPMGYDDNGLPTERLVETLLNIRAAQAGRPAFIEKCLQMAEEIEKDYQALFQRLGLSVDWRYTYRTIDEASRRTSQFSFLELFHKGLAYRRKAPAIWCPECKTAIAQADLSDLERVSKFYTLSFHLEQEAGRETVLPVATTRPELLGACVAVFVHPQDSRFNRLVGQTARVPLFGQSVPVIEDHHVDPEKETGAVMCCTFGDATDVLWWKTYQLPLVEAIGRDGNLTATAGDYYGLPIQQARDEITTELGKRGLVTAKDTKIQTVRVHERCDTPIEYIVTRQWFIRVLEHKDELLEAGEKVTWRPPSMKSRFRNWVENLSWDWCVSRQRYYGVPIPVWYCAAFGHTIPALASQLPVDPSQQGPPHPCPECGDTAFIPEEDVFDTWATSSMSPQIAGRWLEESELQGESLYSQVFPMSVRPQGHEIIRTWAFYTLLKSILHFDTVPWKNVVISGLGIAGEGKGKISKSRGGGSLPPLEMIERYSADALRYWAASTGLGKDAVISEEKIQLGARLVTKLWNVARFSERFLQEYDPVEGEIHLSLQRADPNQQGSESQPLTLADAWILARTQQLIQRVSGLFRSYDHAAAKSEIEVFFWHDLADNYLEMSKQRLYDSHHPQHEGALYCLYNTLLTLIKLFAPILPFVCEEIYQGVFAGSQPGTSIHASRWPAVDVRFLNAQAETNGEALVAIASAVRRYKSEHNLPLGSEITRLQLCVDQPEAMQKKKAPKGQNFQPNALLAAKADLVSVTRASQVEFVKQLEPGLEVILADGPLIAALER